MSISPVSRLFSFLSARPAGLPTSPRQLITEIFAGLVSAFAMIPESTSFAIAIGASPEAGLYSAAVIGMVIAFVGGRPAMISGAAGSVALVMGGLLKTHGFHYLLLAVVLGGIIQIILGACGIAKVMRFVPHSVMTGFVNGLAIIIFMAQVPHMLHVPRMVYVLIGVGLLIIYFFPKLTSAIPAPLIAIIALTLLTILGHISVPQVHDEGAMPHGFPQLLLPTGVPLTIETFTIILPYSMAMALVGLLESFLTTSLVDDETETTSSKKRESIGQGIANIFGGFFGGLPGCAMIGQTVVNVKIAKGRTRVSSFLCGFFVLILVTSLGTIVGEVPMAALVAVMIVVSVSTFDWHSIKPATVRKIPWTETLIMVVTTAITVITANLAFGVVAGVLLAIIIFTNTISQVVSVEVTREDANVKTYRISGELFFASSNELIHEFAYATDPPQVIIDFGKATIWDASTVATLDAITEKYHAKGKHVEFINLNSRSQETHSTLSSTLEP